MNIFPRSLKCGVQRRFIIVVINHIKIGHVNHLMVEMNLNFLERLLMMVLLMVSMARTKALLLVIVIAW